jgi:transcriptional regulator with XRE-family HTH domain
MYITNPSKYRLQNASDIFDSRTMGTTTLAFMEGGKADVGKRIRDCAEDRGIETPAALHKILTQDARNKGTRQTVTRQTVSNWWYGKVYPSLDWLPILAGTLRTDQEWILFGSKRSDQIKRERQYLARISEEEGQLLTVFREASKSAQKTIMKLAKGLSEEDPSPEASVHPFRRKDDKLKS